MMISVGGPIHCCTIGLQLGISLAVSYLDHSSGHNRQLVCLTLLSGPFSVRRSSLLIVIENATESYLC